MLFNRWWTTVWRILLRLAGLQFLAPRWRTPCFVMSGVFCGLGLFVFHLSRAASYLSDAPETCMNCHVMTTEYVTWQHGSHARVATCDDCHVPHTSLAAHYAFKARDGLKHSTIFTLHWEPQALRLSNAAVPVVEENCRRCHAHVVEEVCLKTHQEKDLRCWDCHRETPHGRVRSQSATPDVFQPRLPSAEDLFQRPTLGGRPIQE
jgi:cytochrome c nitrite reductase small subunit